MEAGMIFVWFLYIYTKLKFFVDDENSNESNSSGTNSSKSWTPFCFFMKLPCKFAYAFQETFSDNFWNSIHYLAVDFKFPSFSNYH